MLLTFKVSIDEKLVRRLEEQDDTVFYARLERIIRTELRKFSEVSSHDSSQLHVVETTGGRVGR